MGGGVGIACCTILYNSTQGEWITVQDRGVGIAGSTILYNSIQGKWSTVQDKGGGGES